MLVIQNNPCEMQLYVEINYFIILERKFEAMSHEVLEVLTLKQVKENCCNFCNLQVPSNYHYTGRVYKKENPSSSDRTI